MSEVPPDQRKKRPRQRIDRMLDHFWYKRTDGLIVLDVRDGSVREAKEMKLLHCEEWHNLDG